MLLQAGRRIMHRAAAIPWKKIVVTAVKKIPKAAGDDDPWLTTIPEKKIRLTMGLFQKGRRGTDAACGK